MTKLLRSIALSVGVLLCSIGAISQTADFSFSPDSGCAPMVVTFTDLSGAGVSSWSWNLGNSNSSTLQSPSTTYGTAGTYPVTLTVRGANGTTTKTLNVTVFDKPTASFTATTPGGCAPFTASFTATATLNGPGPGTYSWDFGDGNTGTGVTTNHIYTVPGTYTVSLTVSNAAGCSRTVSRTNYITAFTKPTGSFGANQTVFCSAPGTATFANTTFGGKAPYTSTWNFGDNTTGTGNTPVKTYASSGYYTVTMITTDANGCADTVVNPNFIGVVGQAATFTAPAKACENQQVTVTNMTSGAISATFWDFGDLTPSVSGNFTTHVYDTAGTYTITMTTIVGGCTKTTTKTIIVHPNPTVSISQFPSIPCPPPVGVTFSANPGRTGYTISNYVWTTANGTLTGQSVTDTFKSFVRDGKVKLIVTSSDGCTDSALHDTLQIRQLILNVTPGGFCPKIDTVSGCDPLSVVFGTDIYTPMLGMCAFANYPASILTWNYRFSDGSPNSNLPNPSHRFTPSGDYVVNCTITTSNGCTASGYRPVHVDTPVKPNFYASQLDICPKTPITIYNTTANHLPGTRYTYSVERGDTLFTRPDSASPVIRIVRPGVYTVRLVSNHFGCVDSLIRQQYIRVRPPYAKFSDSVFCYPNQGVRFTNESDSATSYLWLFGDGNTSSQISPIHSYTAAGKYVVTLVAYNNQSNCTDTFRREVLIVRPDVTFQTPDTAICLDGFANFEGSFGNPNAGSIALSYSWQFDNYRTSWDTSTRYTHQFTTRGYHDVTLYVRSGNNCLDSFKRSRYVLSTRPTVMFDASPHVGCMPLSVVLTDNSTNVPGVPAIYKKWTFGTGDSVTTLPANTVPYTYKLRGVYTPKLIVVDSLGCADSLTRNGYIEVYKPTAVFTVNDDSVCTYAPVKFKSFSTGKAPLRYNWTLGDGTVRTTDTFTYFYTKRGSYHVRLIVTDSVGCSDTMDIQNDIVVDAPRAAYTMSDSLAICPPLVISFTNKSLDAVSYSWNFGTGGGPVVVRDPVTTFSNPGLYNVFLVATNSNGCTDTARSKVQVLGYAGALSYTPLTGCAPLAVTFTTPIPGIPILTWDFGDGVTQGTTNSGGVSHTYPSTGAYLPKVIFSDGKGCTSLSEGKDTIRVDKLTADFSWSTPCEGVAFTLTDLSSGIYTSPDSFRWAFGGSSLTASGRSTQFTYGTAGARPVTLTVRNSLGCTATISKDVFINPSPDLNAMVDTAICPGDTAQLRASGAVTYTWSPAPQNPAAGLSCTNCQNPLVYPGGPATYLVTGTDANGCIGHDSTRVIIQIRTTASIGEGGDICLGESFRLKASGAQKYEWLPAATIDSPFIASPNATPRVTTTYIVAAQEGTCLVDSQRVTVVVHAAPDFSAGQDKIIGLGSSTLLEPKGSFTSILWHNRDTTLSCYDCRNPSARPYFTRNYVATAENEWGCKTTDSVTVIVRCNGSLVFIPNTFTPNGDGQNDYFYPQGAGLERMLTFRVFNRWGEQVFDGHDIFLNNAPAGWDGRYKGQLLPPDTYVYSITGLCPTGELIEFKGDVTIMH